jgi:hypothetical protein
LTGSLGGGKPKSTSNPIEAYLSQSSLDIYFLQDLSDITIEIVDEFGEQVFFNEVSPVGGISLHIDISSFDTGEYTIKFVNAKGQYLEGSFVI